MEMETGQKPPAPEATPRKGGRHRARNNSNRASQRPPRPRRPPLDSIQTQPGTLAAWAVDWLLSLVGYKAGTQRKYRDAWQRLSAFLEAIGVQPDLDPPSVLPPNLLADFYRAQMPAANAKMPSRDRLAKDRTARACTYAMVSFLRYLVAKEQLVSVDRYRGTLRSELPRGPYLPREADPRLDEFVEWVLDLPLSMDNTQAMLSTLRDQALISALYCSGLRRAEVVQLTVEHIRNVNRNGDVQILGKGDRLRWIALDERTLRVARAYLALRERHGIYEESLFLSHSTRHNAGERQALHPGSVWRIVKDLAASAEIADPGRFGGLTERLRTHDTRHHFAQSLLDASVPIDVIQRALGHASPDTTARVYARPREAAVLDAVRASAPGHRESGR